MAGGIVRSGARGLRGADFPALRRASGENVEGGLVLRDDRTRGGARG